MKIKREHINWLKFPKEIIELALAPYMEMPKGEFPYVIQHHIRMRSVHADWRMAINGYLLGWTVLDNPKGMPKVMTMKDGEKVDATMPFKFQAKNINVGLRAETKARQPKEWLKVKGVVKPGSVGATRWGPGVFTIWDEGKVIFGVQKPFFHEYFIKSSIGKRFPSDKWTRIIVRKVGVRALGPRKRPLKKKEVMWRVLIPSEQMPYAISDRAMKKNYKPPKTNPMPFPVEWTKKNWPEQFAKWKEWIQGGKKKKEEKTCRKCFRFEICTDPETLANPDRIGCENWRPKEELKKIRFTLHFNSWMGQFVIRGQPKREWYLRLDDQGGGKIRTFYFDTDPVYFQPVSGEDQGRVDRKWLDFEGKVPPRTLYNPNKKIPAFMEIIDKGTVDIETEKEDGIKVINLNFFGKKLKGKWRLVQEEKGSSTYTFEKIEKLAQLIFVLQRHWIPLKENAKFPEEFGHHWDIRFSSGTEWNLYKNPLESEIEEEIEARRKTYPPEKIRPWIEIEKEHTFMKVGPLRTFVDPIDKGKVEIFENTPDFVSMKFFGKKLKGYWVYIRKPSGKQVFVRSRLPKAKLTNAEGDPSVGNYFKPFRVEKKKGWDHYWLHIYSPLDFSRCVEDPTEYIPELKNKPPEILEVLVCLYPRPGTIHGARVQAVKVSDKWSVEKASDWIKKMKLHTWSGKLIRKKREKIELLEEENKKIDEALARVLENIAKKSKEEKTEEERKLELEIKKKKLELLEKWLEANKG